MFEEVKPTRSELIKIRKRIELSQKGYDLLKKKRDGLILEFFEVLETASEIRKDLYKKYDEAELALSVALAMEGGTALRSAASAVEEEGDVAIRSENIMGVVIPRVTFAHKRRSIATRGYGITSTSIYIENAASEFEEFLEMVAKAAEVETSLRRLLVEIDKVKKRINALEQKIIPGLEETEKHITLRLEELERESIFRLKRIKQKSEAKS